ncbi:MAG: HigA family addiction module antitoxin [Devosia sp.]
MVYRLANPVHPGDFLRTEIVDPLRLSVTAVAEILGVTRPTLSSLLNGRSALSTEMALRVEKAFGVSMDTLMRMQMAYDVAAQRKREGDVKVRPYKAKVA